MWNIKRWRQKVRIRLSATRPVLKKRSHLGSISVNDAHISDTVHGKVQMFGKFPELSKFILQRQTARLTYWTSSSLWLTSPNERVRSLGVHLCGDLCDDVSVFLQKEKKKKNSKRKSLGKIVYPADFYCPS